MLSNNQNYEEGDDSIGLLSTHEEEQAENSLIDVFENRRPGGSFYGRNSDAASEPSAQSQPPPPTTIFKPMSKKVGASVLANIALRLKRAKDKQQQAPTFGVSSQVGNNDAFVHTNPPVRGKALFKEIAMRVQKDIHDKRTSKSNDRRYGYGAVEPTDRSHASQNSSRRQRTQQPRQNHHMTFANLSTNGYFAAQNNVDLMLDRAEQIAKLLEPKNHHDDDFEEYDKNSTTKHPDEEAATGTAQILKRVKEKRSKQRRGCCARLCRSLRDQYYAVQEVLNPRFVFRATCHFLFFRVILIMVPCVALAAFLFYRLGNPELKFLPGDASVSWWLIFFVRQMVTLQLAVILEHIFCDIIALRSTLSVKFLGPLVTLSLCNAEGWPFVISLWSIIDLCLLHGDQPFIRNWLYFLDIDLLGDENPDHGLLMHDFYVRILWAVFIVGVATIFKRTQLALYFGKRMFLHFRARMEKILGKMQILSQLASLVDMAEDEEFKCSLRCEPVVAFVNRISDSPIELSADSTSSRLESHESERLKEMLCSSDLTQDQASQFRSMLRVPASVKGSQIQLENWDDPISISEKNKEPLIQEILYFRKALSYMRSSHPFNHSFGPANSRENFLKSAVRLHGRLQQLFSDDSKEKDAVSFEIISAVVYDDDGRIDKNKKSALKKMFRPDRNNEVQFLPFMQSCDAVYKQLVFFLAAVESSARIDAVLECLANAFFMFMLILVIMTVLNFDPWSLLLSLSSLLVSFSFAVGPSVSAFVGGVMLIANRRPYDVGDRVLFNSPTSDDCFKPGTTWLVEDVNLSYTTLRFAATNEVASVSNASIANLRIHNGNRDFNVLVTIPLFFRITATYQEIEHFFVAVKKFLAENKENWGEIKFFRTEHTDTPLEYIEYRLRVEHSKTHQATPIVMRHKGELMRFCAEEMIERDIHSRQVHNTVDLYVKDNNNGTTLMENSNLKKDKDDSVEPWALSGPVLKEPQKKS